MITGETSTARVFTAGRGNRCQRSDGRVLPLRNTELSESEDNEHPALTACALVGGSSRFRLRPSELTAGFAPLPQEANSRCARAQ